jgi:AcrR family transcriptional regulator
VQLNIVEKSKKKYLKYASRHQKLLDVAIQLFNLKGYHAATTAEIANKAGISEPTMYKHFKNKKDLFLACFRSISDKLLADYRDVYQKYRNDEIRYLEGVTKAYIDFVVQNPHKSMFLVHLLCYRDDPEFATVLKDFMERNIESIRRILESAKRKGRLKSNIDLRVLACVFVNQYFPVIASREFVSPKHFSSDAYLRLMLDMLGID